MKHDTVTPRFARWLMVGTVALGATACATSTPRLDANMGVAVREARAVQTLNPQASEQNRDPVLGIDGKAASEAQRRYVDSFKAPPKTFEIINIGGAITGD
ncbi:hypothetical protein J2W49_003470 [Hydrogenophaga palleronii]|uniref:Pilus assembly protein n=1 Tax=Hydrogenophaga palleronii TaxID=65655 RepID=A0ABU1WR20_9BURK|nr:hypothetical protein [Hydrogenophaga palleronii]MDR7151494.1 hypothetical protein [Hydrogenophaga palleronii]